MKGKERLTKIVEILRGVIPKVLNDEGLNPVNFYKVGEPTNMTASSCSVVSLGWDNDPSEERLRVGVIFRIVSGATDVYDYEGVLVPAIWEALDPEELEFTTLESVNSTVKPPQEKDAVLVTIQAEFRREKDNDNKWGGF